MVFGVGAGTTYNGKRAVNGLGQHPINVRDISLAVFMQSNMFPWIIIAQTDIQ